MNEKNESLLLGTRSGDVNMVKIAIEKGADVNVKGAISLRRTALFSNTQSNSSSLCF